MLIYRGTLNLLQTVYVEGNGTTMLRIIFMGTPQFAVPALEALIAGARPGLVLPEGYEIIAVITRPDKPVVRPQ